VRAGSVGLVLGVVFAKVISDSRHGGKVLFVVSNVPLIDLTFN
jgi:hypothetical protein